MNRIIFKSLLWMSKMTMLATNRLLYLYFAFGERKKIQNSKNYRMGILEIIKCISFSYKKGAVI